MSYDPPHARTRLRGRARTAAEARYRQPSPQGAVPNPGEARRHGRARVPRPRLGHHEAAAHRHLRLGVEADLLRLRELHVEGSRLGRQPRQPDEELRVIPARDGARSRGRCRRARSGSRRAGSWRPRGPEPVAHLRVMASRRCPACEAGDPSQCWSFGRAGSLPVSTGMCKDVPGGFGELMPAHDSMLFKVPGDLDEQAARRSVRVAAGSPAIRRHRGARSGVRRRRGTSRSPSSALYPDVEVMAVARRHGSPRPRRPTVVPEPRASSSSRRGLVGRRAQPADGLPMAFPAGSTCTTRSAAETLEVGARVLRARGTLVKLGMPTARWKTRRCTSRDHVHRLQCVRVRGGRRRTPTRDRALPGSGRLRSHRPDRHAHPYVPARRVAARSPLSHPGRGGAISRHRPTLTPDPVLASCRSMRTKRRQSRGQVY